MKPSRIYLGIGGNEGPVMANLEKAIFLLKEIKEFSHFNCSSFYNTAPHEMDHPLWFINAVCSFETTLSPHEVYMITQSIERQLGKIPKPKNMGRSIDIDILFYGSERWQNDTLEIPHPRWKERLFVLVPLADLISEITIQDKERYILKEMIDQLKNEGRQKIDKMSCQ